MNIFYVHPDPVVAARMLCDKHVVKMPLETAQILCTVASLHGYEVPYKPTHVHHPCVRWVASDRRAWEWLVEHGLALCDEYTQRYHRRTLKAHAAEEVIEQCKALGNEWLPKPRRAELPAKAMPARYRHRSAVKAYRDYYAAEKSSIARWNRGRPAPSWFTERVAALKKLGALENVDVNVEALEVAS